VRGVAVDLILWAQVSKYRGTVDKCQVRLERKPETGLNWNWGAVPDLRVGTGQQSNFFCSEYAYTGFCATRATSARHPVLIHCWLAARQIDAG
jgi:hypothetical protein